MGGERLGAAVLANAGFERINREVQVCPARVAQEEVLLVAHVLVSPSDDLIVVTTSARVRHIVVRMGEWVTIRSRLGKLLQHELYRWIGGDHARADHVRDAVATDLLSAVTAGGVGAGGVVDLNHVTLPVLVIPEVTTNFRQRRHTLAEGLANTLPETFVAEEEKGLVLSVVKARKFHGSPDVKTKLILVEWPPIGREEITGVQTGIAQVFVGGAVKLVGARLGGEIDYAARETAPLRVQVIRLNLEFLKRVLGGNQAELVDVTVVQRHAVEILRALVGDGTSNLVVAVVEGILPHGVALRLSLRHHAGGERHQVHRVAPVERQFVYLARLDDLTQVAGCRLK